MKTLKVPFPDSKYSTPPPQLIKHHMYRAIATGGGLQLPNNLLIIIFFQNNADLYHLIHDMQTAKNEDITHTFL